MSVWKVGGARARPGFTLLEAIVVMIVLALLAGLVGSEVFGRLSQARAMAARTQVELFATALDSYRLDNGAYPTTEQGLQALVERPARPPVPANWRGPYLRGSVPQDPWGRPYIYRSPGADPATSFELRSLGRDGEPGGEDEDADIGGR